MRRDLEHPTRHDDTSKRGWLAIDSSVGSSTKPFVLEREGTTPQTIARSRGHRERGGCSAQIRGVYGRDKMRHSRISPILWGAVLFITALTHATPGSAGEDVDSFLRALYDRQYFDTALEYIEQIKTSPLVDSYTKSAIPFLHAQTEHYRGRTIPDSKIQEKEEQLRKAIASYQAFAKAQPNHPRAVDSLLEVSNVYRTLAKSRVDSSTSNAKLLAEAQAFLKQAEVALVAVKKKLNQQLEALRKSPPDVDDISILREQLNSYTVRAKYGFAEVAHEMASAFPEGSPQRKQQFAVAAERYETFYDDHDDLTIGIRAIVRAGQCYRDSGNVDFALSCFESILGDAELAKIEALSDLRNETIREAMVLWIDQIIKAKNYRAALPIFDNAFLVSKVPKKLLDDPDEQTLGVLYFRAKLAATMAEKMRRIKIKEIEKRHQELFDYASETFALVAKSEGPFQAKAAAVYKEMTGEAPEIPKGDVKSFAGARKQAHFISQQWIAARNALQEAPEEKKAALRERVEEEGQKVIDLLKQALSFADADTNLVQLSDVYARLANTYWNLERYREAAVMGEFLARRYPEAINAQVAADIAIRSWAKMYDDAKAAKQDFSFEQGQIETLAGYISEQWPDTDVASNALYRLLTFAYERKDEDLDAGLAIIAKLPEGGPHRATGQLMFGPSLWFQYLKLNSANQKQKNALSAKRADLEDKQSKLDEAAFAEWEAKLTAEEEQVVATDTRLASMLEQSEEMLSGGLQTRINMNEAAPRMGFYALYLAQLYVHKNQPEEAVNWLQHEQVGPLKLLSEGAEIITSKPKQVTSIYKTSVEGYVKLLSTLSGTEFDKTMDFVITLMDKMEGSMENKALVAGIYTSLGREIGADIERRRQEGDVVGATRLIRAFHTILVRISSQPGGSYGTLAWVATNLKDLGTTSQRLAENSNTSDKERAEHLKKAKTYFGQAADAYKKILKNKTEFKIKENVELALNSSLATCQVGMGKYKDAIATCKTILQKNSDYAAAQLTAARALQADKQFTDAVIGQGPPVKRGSRIRLIWGWEQISRRFESVRQKKQSFHDIYFEALLGKLTCLIESGKAGNKGNLKKARQTYARLKAQYDDLGGEDWAPKFEKARSRLQ